MKLRSPRGRRETAEERRSGPRSPTARRLQKAREERRKRRAEGGTGAAAGAPEEFTGVTLRAGDIAAAVVLLGGLLLIAMPHHGGTIMRLVLVGLAATAALHAVNVIVPEGSVSGWWRSPFDPQGRDGAHLRPSGEIERIRAKLSGRRQRVRNGRPLPPETVRMLQPLIAVALERAGLDPLDGTQRPEIRRRVAPLTWAVLNSDPLYLPRWYETRAPDERQVADVVRRVLDDLERIASGDRGEPSHEGSPRPRER